VTVLAAKIRLKRAGSRHRPFYKIVVIDSRSSRDGSSIEAIGHYDPVKKPEVLQVDEDRLNHWLSQGAATSDSVGALLRRLKKRREGGDAFETEMKAPAPPMAEPEGAPKAERADEGAVTRATGAEPAAPEGAEASEGGASSEEESKKE
jgi:small subunit ribosomal protein S16